MVVHLKRFDYDWEANRAIKFDDYFEVRPLSLSPPLNNQTTYMYITRHLHYVYQFPWILDMEPYTAQGIEAREKAEPPLPPQMYDLVGIVVHSGQASAGHYYSFIKEKRLDQLMFARLILPVELCI